MGILPAISGAECVKALGRDGFYKASQKGAHVKLKHPVRTELTVIVPLHAELKRGTLQSILRQAKLTAEEFKALL